MANNDDMFGFMSDGGQSQQTNRQGQGNGRSQGRGRSGESKGRQGRGSNLSREDRAKGGRNSRGGGR